MRKIIAVGLIVLLVFSGCDKDSIVTASANWRYVDNVDYILFEENGKYYLKLIGKALEEMQNKSEPEHSGSYRELIFPSIQEMITCITENRFTDSQRTALISHCYYFGKDGVMELFDPNHMYAYCFPGESEEYSVYWNAQKYGIRFSKGSMWMIPQSEFEHDVDLRIINSAKELLETGKLEYDERNDAYVHFPTEHGSVRTKRVYYYQIEDGATSVYVKESHMVNAVLDMDIEFDPYFYVVAYYDTPEGCFGINAKTEDVPTREWLLQFSLKSIA